MRTRMLSFKHAFTGIRVVASSEANFRIHLLATTIASLLGFCLGIARSEWIAVLLCFAVVMAAEAFNGAVERLVDFVSPGVHPAAGTIKDVAAGAVLITAIVAAIIGCIIFVPKILAALG